MTFLFQLFFALFIIFAVWGVWEKRREGLLSLRGTTFWILFWLLAGAVVAYPKSASMLAERLGIGRGADLIIYTSIAVLFYIVFRLHVKLEMVNRDVTKAVRKQAIDEISHSPKV